MKNLSRLRLVALAGALFALALGCQNDERALVPVSDVSPTADSSELMAQTQSEPAADDSAIEPPALGDVESKSFAVEATDSADSRTDSADAEPLAGDVSRVTTVSVQQPVVDPRAQRSLAAARAKGEITFDDLAFDIEKDGKFEDGMLTADILKLHERVVTLRGYILPTSVFQHTGIEQFVLVRDDKECCFGPGAAIYDCVMVQMASGVAAEFTTRPIAVTGKFEIDTKSFLAGDRHLAIFKMTATKVQ